MMYSSISEIQATGNIQYNSKSAKDFRDSLAKWHNATMELADEILQKSDRVKAYKSLIQSNEEMLQSDTTTKTKADLQAEIDEYQAKIDAENVALAEYKQAQADRFKAGHDLVPDSLHTVYSAYVDDRGDAAHDDYVVALANWLQTNGVKPTIQGVEALLGAKSVKRNSARQKAKTGKHNGSLSKNVFKDVFLGDICDALGDKVLPLHKFVWQPKNAR